MRRAGDGPTLAMNNGREGCRPRLGAEALPQSKPFVIVTERPTVHNKHGSMSFVDRCVARWPPHFRLWPLEARHARHRRAEDRKRWALLFSLERSSRPLSAEFCQPSSEFSRFVTDHLLLRRRRKRFWTLKPKHDEDARPSFARASVLLRDRAKEDSAPLGNLASACAR
jgi:hypothetical protein